jgi:hypothetical protein
MDHMIRFRNSHSGAVIFYGFIAKKGGSNVPYADGYDIGPAVFDRKKGFVLKPRQTRTEINTIGSVKKHPVENEENDKKIRNSHS